MYSDRGIEAFVGDCIVHPGIHRQLMKTIFILVTLYLFIKILDFNFSFLWPGSEPSDFKAKNETVDSRSTKIHLIHFRRGSGLILLCSEETRSPLSFHFTLKMFGGEWGISFQYHKGFLLYLGTTNSRRYTDRDGIQDPYTFDFWTENAISLTVFSVPSVFHLLTSPHYWQNHLHSDLRVTPRWISTLGVGLDPSLNRPTPLRKSRVPHSHVSVLREKWC